MVSWISLFIQFIREKNKEKETDFFTFLIAFTLGVLIQFYIRTIAPAIADTVFNSPEYYMPIILMIFIPIIFAYAIFKYNLLDVSIVIRNTIIYGAAMATVAGIYFVVIYLLGQGIGKAFGSENQGISSRSFLFSFCISFFNLQKIDFRIFLQENFILNNQLTKEY